MAKRLPSDSVAICAPKKAIYSRVSDRLPVEKSICRAHRCHRRPPPRTGFWNRFGSWSASRNHHSCYRRHHCRRFWWLKTSGVGANRSHDRNPDSNRGGLWSCSRVAGGSYGQRFPAVGRRFETGKIHSQTSHLIDRRIHCRYCTGDSNAAGCLCPRRRPSSG